MSELVRKVCDALNDASGGDCDPKIFEGDARAAIKAIAEWIHGEGDDRYDAAYAKLLLAQLEAKP